MADPPITPPVDPSTLQSWAKYQKYLEDTKQSTDKLDESTVSLKKEFKDASDTVHNFIANITKGKDALTAMSMSAGESQEALYKAGISVNTLSKAFLTLGTMTGPSDVFKGFSKALDQGQVSFTGYGEKLNELKGRFSNAKDTIGSLITTIPGLSAAFQKASGGNLSSMLGQSAKSGIELLQRFAEKADSARRAETAFMQIAAASGQLGKAFTGAAVDSTKLQTGLLQMASLTQNLAITTGLLPEKLAEMAAMFGKTIPGALDQTIVAAGGINNFDAVLRLAAGSGRSFNDILDDLKTAYDELGLSGEKALKFTALISETSNALGIRLTDVESTLKTVAANFRYIGDNTEAATRAMARFVPALRETGLSAKASSDLVAGMINNVKNLEIGTKAFISARSGGPGGLQGAFQIEKLMREGKMDEVMKMVEGTLKKQIGGKIVSLQEASQSPELAAQRFKQQAMLKSGAFGGLAKNDEEASRILDAMATGASFSKETGNIIKSGQDAMAEQISRGNSIQERNASALDASIVFLDRIATASDIQAMNIVKKEIGTDNPYYKQIYNQQKSTMQDYAKSYGTKNPTIEDYNAVTVSQTGTQAGMGANAITAQTKDSIKPVAPKPTPKKSLPPINSMPKQKALVSPEIIDNSNKQPTTGFQPNTNPGQAPPQDVHVNVKGICINCGLTMNGEPDNKNTSASGYKLTPS